MPDQVRSMSVGDAVVTALKHGVKFERRELGNESECEPVQVEWFSTAAVVDQYETPFVLLGVLAYLISGLLLAFITWLHLRVIYGPHIQVTRTLRYT